MSEASQIVVIALDAADYDLLQKWDCNNVLQSNAGRLKTRGYSTDVPSTADIWPLMAGGTVPDGAEKSHRPQWDNPLLRLGAWVGDYAIPDDLQAQLGERLTDEADYSHELARVDPDKVPFDNVEQWPGASHAEFLHAQWDLMGRVSDGEVSEEEIWNTTHSYFAQMLGWAEYQQGLVGFHTHILDVAGHVYADDEAKLREYYESVDEQIGDYADDVEELVVLSDHGMQVSCLDDEEPGVHSSRAMVSTSWDTALPTDVEECHGWFETLSESIQTNERRVGDLDAPREHLEDLGYLEA